MSFLASLRKEMMEQIRTGRLWVLLVVLGMFGMSSPLLAQVMPELLKVIPGAEQFAALVPVPTIKDALDQYVKNIGQFALFLAIFMPMGAVVQEKERGTAVLMLVKPLSRGAFLMAKFVALAAAFGVSLAVAGGLGYVYTTFLFKAPDALAWVMLNLLIWVYCLVFIAITLAASTLLRSQAAAAGVGFGAFLLMSAVGALPNLGQYLPGQLVNWGSELFRNPQAAYWPALLVSIALIAGSLVVAWLSFRRQEL